MSGRFVWGTVTAVAPLRVQLDGDTEELPITPDSLVDPLTFAVGDRVRCELSQRRVIAHGRAGGAAPEVVASYRMVQTIYFTSSGTFTKATYPWLRAIRVRLVGGGGAGGGATATASNFSTGTGGGGGGYAEAFITDVAALASSVAVTIGAGGAGAAGGTGGAGGASSFGSLIVATGGGGGTTKPANVFAPYAKAPQGGVGTAGSLLIGGNAGGQASGYSDLGGGGSGGGSFLGGGGAGYAAGSGGASGDPGRNYGGGGGGAYNSTSQAARAGGAGAPGIVIVELYA